MPLAAIPSDPEPTKRQYARFMNSGLSEPMRTLWAKFQWRYERQKTRPNDFLVAYVRDKEWYFRVYLRSKEWRLIRSSVLALFNYKCACCGGVATEVHHRDYRPRVLSGEDFSALVALCRRCHDEIEKIKGEKSWNAAEARLAQLVAQREAEG